MPGLQEFKEKNAQRALEADLEHQVRALVGSALDAGMDYAFVGGMLFSIGEDLVEGYASEVVSAAEAASAASAGDDWERPERTRAKYDPILDDLPPL